MQMRVPVADARQPAAYDLPDATGHFGPYGGTFVAETLQAALAELRDAAEHPDGTPKPTRVSEARKAEEARKEREAIEKARQEQENITFGQFFKQTYFPISKTSKKRESYKKEEEHFRLYLEPVLGDKPLREIKPLTIERVKKKGRKIGICGQAPSDYPEFAEFLVECGIDSISLNPDSVIKTRLIVAEKERQLGR